MIAFVTVVPATVYSTVPVLGESKVSVTVPTCVRTTLPGLNGPPNHGPVVW